MTTICVNTNLAVDALMLTRATTIPMRPLMTEPIASSSVTAPVIAKETNSMNAVCAAEVAFLKATVTAMEISSTP